MAADPVSPLAAPGVEEAGVIIPQATRDRFSANPISGWWRHGFNLRRLSLQTGAYVPMHARREAEVLFVQEGTVEVSWNLGALVLGAGDTLAVPVGLAHGFRNTASTPCRIYVVRGGDDPALPGFATGYAAA